MLPAQHFGKRRSRLSTAAFHRHDDHITEARMTLHKYSDIWVTLTNVAVEESVYMVLSQCERLDVIQCRK